MSCCAEQQADMSSEAAERTRDGMVSDTDAALRDSSRSRSSIRAFSRWPGLYLDLQRKPFDPAVQDVQQSGDAARRRLVLPYSVMRR